MCEKGLRFTELHGTLFLFGEINIFDIQVYQEKKSVCSDYCTQDWYFFFLNLQLLATALTVILLATGLAELCFCDLKWIGLF